MTTTVFNTIINEINNKIPVANDLVKNIDYDAMSKIEGKYITTSDHNKFTKEVLDIRGSFFDGDGSQNSFFYQPTLDMLGLKKYKGTGNVLSLKTKGVYTSKLKPLYTAFLHSIKLLGYTEWD